MIHFIITFKESNSVLDSCSRVKGFSEKWVSIPRGPLTFVWWLAEVGARSLLCAKLFLTLCDIGRRPDCSSAVASPRCRQCAEVALPEHMVDGLPGPTGGLSHGFLSLAVTKTAAVAPLCRRFTQVHTRLERKSCRWCLLGQRVYGSVFVSRLASWPPEIVHSFFFN